MYNILHLLSYKHVIQCKLLYFSANCVSLSINNNYNYINSVCSVHLVHAPNVTVYPKVATKIYNSTFNLTCTVMSLAVPNIIWSSTAPAGLLSQPSVRSDIATHTSILTLEQVNLNYTGLYICTAVNEGGNDTATTNITIFGKEYNKVLENDE